MADIKYEIKEELGEISTSARGWTKELRPFKTWRTRAGGRAIWSRIRGSGVRCKFTEVKVTEKFESK